MAAKAHSRDCFRAAKSIPLCMRLQWVLVCSCPFDLWSSAGQLKTYVGASEQQSSCEMLSSIVAGA